MAAFDPKDAFDFSNPDDLAEFKTLPENQVRVTVDSRDP
jgi:hypothetical protein